MSKKLIWEISHEPVPYLEAVEAMENYVAKIHQEDAPDKVWILEHSDIYTGGVSANQNDLINKDIELIKTGRGGQITYHGPGMLIAYVMLNLKRRSNCDVKKYICNLEKWLINSLANFDIIGETRKDRVGIWVKSKDNSEQENKISAIGVRLRKWISFHGIALNISPDLTKFNQIIPCGISNPNYGVTSFAKLGIDVDRQKLIKILQTEFEKIFDPK